ncbi:MAG: chromosomal replication initiator DnaA [Rhodobacterales bacterium]|nr:MAG: chromosomal replication initiator DnaA [Rhodobacterales bacterium]
MARQLAFDLPHRTARGRGDFFVSDSNASALDAIEQWQGWPGRKLLLVGPEGAGKSHLVQVWAGLAGAEVVEARRLDGTGLAALEGHNIALEGADTLAGDPTREQAAFHLHNLVLAAGGHLLLTARDAPGRWGLTLPDLESRMSGTRLVRIDPPDDALLAAVIVKLFADRQIGVSPRVVSYLTRRLDRSLAAAGEAVARLDAAALAEGSKVSVELAGRVLFGAET